MALSLLAGRTALYNAFITGTTPTVAGINNVVKAEPLQGEVSGGLAPAITIASYQITPTEFRYRLKIWVAISGTTEDAADLLDSLIPLVEAKITSEFGPSEWTIRGAPGDWAMVAECIIETGREDF